MEQPPSVADAAICHPLGDALNMRMLAASAALAVLALFVFLRFTAALDVGFPQRSELFGLAILLAIACLGGIALFARSIALGGVHRATVLAALVAGLVGGMFYGLAAYPTDFYQDILGPLFGYMFAQFFLLLPAGLLALIAAVVLWRLYPNRAPAVSAGLAFVPVALQIGFHGGLALTLIASLERLMATARKVNAPRESDAVSVLWLLCLVALLHLARPRR